MSEVRVAHKEDCFNIPCARDIYTYLFIFVWIVHIIIICRGLRAHVI